MESRTHCKLKTLKPIKIVTSLNRIQISSRVGYYIGLSGNDQKVVWEASRNSIANAMRSHFCGKKSPSFRGSNWSRWNPWLGRIEQRVSPDFGFTTAFIQTILRCYNWRIVMASAGQDKVKDLFATEPYWHLKSVRLTWTVTRFISLATLCK